MNMQLDIIFAVILRLMNIPKMKSLTHICSLAFQNNCGYAFTKHGYREEGYGSMSQFSFMSAPFLLHVSQCSLY